MACGGGRYFLLNTYQQLEIRITFKSRDDVKSVPAPPSPCLLQLPFPITKKQTPPPHEEGNGLTADSEQRGYGYTKLTQGGTTTPRFLHVAPSQLSPKSERTRLARARWAGPGPQLFLAGDWATANPFCSAAVTLPLSALRYIPPLCCSFGFSRWMRSCCSRQEKLSILEKMTCLQQVSTGSLRSPRAAAALPLPRSVPGRSAGAAAPGRLLGNLSPPAPGAAPCWRTQPPLQSRVPAEHKSSPAASPAAFSLSFVVSSDSGLPVSPGCSPLWQRPGAEVRLPHLGCAEAAPGCARAPPAVPTVPTVPAPGLCQVKRSRWKWFVVEVEAGCSSFLRWRTPLPFVFDWRGSVAHLCWREPDLGLCKR